MASRDGARVRLVSMSVAAWAYGVIESGGRGGAPPARDVGRFWREIAEGKFLYLLMGQLEKSTRRSRQLEMSEVLVDNFVTHCRNKFGLDTSAVKGSYFASPDAAERLAVLALFERLAQQVYVSLSIDLPWHLQIEQSFSSKSRVAERTAAISAGKFCPVDEGDRVDTALGRAAERAGLRLRKIEPATFVLGGDDGLVFQAFSRYDTFWAYDASNGWREASGLFPGGIPEVKGTDSREIKLSDPGTAAAEGATKGDGKEGVGAEQKKDTEEDGVAKGEPDGKAGGVVGGDRAGAEVVGGAGDQVKNTAGSEKNSGTGKAPVLTQGDRELEEEKKWKRMSTLQAFGIFMQRIRLPENASVRRTLLVCTLLMCVLPVLGFYGAETVLKSHFGGRISEGLRLALSGVVALVVTQSVGVGYIFWSYRVDGEDKAGAGGPTPGAAVATAADLQTKKDQ